MASAGEMGRSEQRRGRRARWVFALVGIAALVAYEFWPSDERRIAALLDDLCAHLNQARDEPGRRRLQGALRSRCLPNAELRVDEFGLDLRGPDALFARFEAAHASGAPLSFALSSVEVRVSGDLARADGDLQTILSGSSEQSRDLRRTRVRLKKEHSRWQIEAVEVDPVPPAEPEPRP